VVRTDGGVVYSNKTSNLYPAHQVSSTLKFPEDKNLLFGRLRKKAPEDPSPLTPVMKEDGVGGAAAVEVKAAQLPTLLIKETAPDTSTTAVVGEDEKLRLRKEKKKARRLARKLRREAENDGKTDE